jgi:hypothetical protein
MRAPSRTARRLLPCSGTFRRKKQQLAISNPAEAGSSSLLKLEELEPPIPATATGAAVWTERLLVAPVPPGVTTGGVKTAVAPTGRPVADSVTGRLKFPADGATLIWYVAAAPALMVCGEVGDATVKSGTVPVPVNVAE